MLNLERPYSVFAKGPSGFHRVYVDAMTEEAARGQAARLNAHPPKRPDGSIVKTGMTYSALPYYTRREPC